MHTVGAGYVRARAELTAVRRLRRLGDELTESADIPRILGVVLDAALELIGADAGLVQTADGEIVGRRGAIGDERTFRSSHTTTLVSRSGEIVGLLSTHHRSPRRLDEDESCLLELIARQGADAVERVQTMDRLRASERAKDDLLATLAHELRSPLAPMRTALDLVKSRPDDRDRAGRAHQILDEQLTQLVRLVDDLVDVSRLARDACPLPAEPVDLAAVTRDCVEKARRAAEAARQHLFVSAPETPVVVIGDPTRLAHVVLGLVEHAADHAGDGANVRVDLGSDAVRGRAVLTVTDDGPGLPRRGSPGVGLTRVEKLVARHQGTLSVTHGDDGRGTRITVDLPLCRALPARRRRALVVDDNADGANLLAEILGDQDVEVVTACDGATALELLPAFAPDVVFLDLCLPDLDGNVVAARIRASDLPTQPLLVAVTGRTKDVATGFDHHVVKPIDIGTIVAILAT